MANNREENSFDLKNGGGESVSAAKKDGTGGNDASSSENGGFSALSSLKNSDGGNADLSARNSGDSASEEKSETSPERPDGEKNETSPERSNQARSETSPERPDGEKNETSPECPNEAKSETSPERPDGSVETKKNGFSLRTITIVGQIEGHSELPQSQKSTKYELLIPQLVEIEENDEIDALLLILNTVGGDVEAGLALSELISGMKKPTASIVLGGGHSIGVPLAVCTKRSFIVPTATMTLHPVRTTGLVLSAPQSFVQLSRMQERIVSFVSGHSNISPDRLRELMLSSDEMTTDLGTILDGKAAVSEGLIDQIGSLSDATDYLKETSGFTKDSCSGGK